VAVSIRAGGTVNVSGTAVGSIATTVAATAAATDLTLLMVVAKPFNTTIGALAGWTLIGEFASGSTANAVDAGSTKTAVFYRIGVAASTVVSVGPILTGADTATCGCSTYQNATGVWSFAWNTAADDANGANFAATAATGLSMINGDMLVANVGLNSDNGTTSAVTLQGTTSGVTTRQTGNTNTGNDCKLMQTDRAITTTDNAATNFSYTNASNTAGGVIFVRLSEAPLPSGRPPFVNIAALQRASSW
jgi:hypothetical protein